MWVILIFFFFQAEDGIRDYKVTGVQTCALPISCRLVRLTATRGWPYPVATAPHPRCPAVRVGGGHCDIASIGRRDNALYAGRTRGKSASAPAPAARSGIRAHRPRTNAHDRERVLAMTSPNPNDPTRGPEQRPPDAPIYIDPVTHQQL